MTNRENQKRESYLIEKYLHQQLTKDEATELKNQLEKNDFIWKLMENIFESADESMFRKKMEVAHKKVVFRHDLRRVAAVVLPLFFVGLLYYFLSKDPINSPAFAIDINFEPYPTAAFQREMSKETAFRFKETFIAYEKGDYKSAVSLFQKEMPYDEENIFLELYYGISLVGAKQNHTAIPILEQIIATTPNAIVKEKAQWYLALAFLQENDMESAKPLLERFNNTRGIYHKLVGKI